jgi:hypothetical protein
MYNGFAVSPQGNSFRNAFANTEWFGLSYFGFFCYDDDLVRNPMNACYYSEDGGYPKGGKPGIDFSSRVTFKMKYPSTTISMVTSFGAHPDAYKGYFAGSCMVIAQPASINAYLFGGRDPSNIGSVATTDFTAAIRNVDLTTDTPNTLITADTIKPLEGSMSSTESDNIWLVGGIGAYSNSDTKKYGVPLNFVCKFNTSSETNQVLPSKLPMGRGFGVATTNMSRTKMHIAGGGELNYNNWFDVDSISIIDFATGTECVRCESTLGISRVGHMGASI